MSFVVPDACALPTVEQPLRVTEFDELFATAVRQVETLRPTHARLRLTGPAGLETTVRDLTARETACCSFFTFTVTPQSADDGEALTLDIVVPARYADMLDALMQQAAAVSSGTTPYRASQGGLGGHRSPGRERPRGPEGGVTAPPVKAGLRTGEVAERAGVNIQTLRYYERRGLLAEPNRSNGGHRLYPPETVAVLNVIKAAQRLGFTLDEVAELLAAGRRRHPTPDLQQRATDKIAEVDAKIADLTSIRAALTDVVDARCDSLTNCTCADCPIPFLTIGTALDPDGATG